MTIYRYISMAMAMAMARRNYRNAVLAVVALLAYQQVVSSEKVVDVSSSLLSTQEIEEQLQVSRLRCIIHHPSSYFDCTLTDMIAVTCLAMWHPPTNHRPQCSAPPRHGLMAIQSLFCVISICLACVECSYGHPLHLWASQLPPRSVSSKHRPFVS